MHNEQSLRDMLLRYNEPRRFASGVSSARRPVQAGAKEYSPEELKALLATLSNMGVGRDELIAHITADEARLLKARGGSGQRNPRTGLLSFDDGDGDGGSGYGDGGGESYGGESYGGESYGGESYGGEGGYGSGGMDWSGFNDSYNANSLSDMFGDISNYEGYDSSMDDSYEDPDLAALNAIEAQGKFDNKIPGVVSEKSALQQAYEAGLIEDQREGAKTASATAGAPFGGLGGFGGRGEASPYGGVSAGPLSTGDVNMVTYSNAGLTPWSQEMLDDEQQQQATTGTQTAGTTGTQTAGTTGTQTAETTGGRGAVTNDNLGTIDVTADLGGTFTNDGSGGEDDYRRRRYIGATGVAPERGDPEYIEWLRLTADGGNNDYARGGSTNQGLRRLYRKYARGGSV